MQSSYDSAVTHVKSGMKILSEVTYSQETHDYQHDVLGEYKTPYASLGMLQEMFVHLDLQATQVDSPALKLIYSNRSR